VTTHPHRIHLGRPRGNPWLLAVVTLSAAVVGLGAWVIIDRTTSASSTRGLASPDVVSMLRGRVAALNSGDAKRIAAFYTRDAVLEERDVTPAVVTQGSDQIAERIAGIVRVFGMRLEQTGPVIRLGGTVAEATRASAGGAFGDDGFVIAYQLDASGLIAHQWVLPAPPS
jgi:ketosteroid isomerase-like protein